VVAISGHRAALRFEHRPALSQVEYRCRFHPLFARDNSGKTRCYRVVFPLLWITGKSARKHLKENRKFQPKIQHNSGRKKFRR
jgi:hypothetical protein